MVPGSPLLRSLGRDDRLAATASALAAVTEVELHVLFAIVDGDLFARANAPDGAIEHAPAHELGFRVRLARVIDVTREVLARRAIDGPAPVDLEQIFVGAAAVELLCDTRRKAAAP